MINGIPSVCGWVPPNAGDSIYSIVMAHLCCMDVNQLKQMQACRKDNVLIYIYVDQRLAKLIALGKTRMDCKHFTEENMSVKPRFTLLEID